jgi:hypothetical protein
LEPKVFISHASEDKARFVVEFAQRLRQSGVDAWLDQWEMRPGDSLVDKVFEEGIAKAQAVIVVISAVSVTKPWVREELNLAVVKRIGKGLKLIPVVIDACEIPASLQSTVWQRIDDLEHYDEAFHRILGAIFDTSTKPALGTPPPRFTDAEPKIKGLNRTDERVLREIAYREVDLNDWPVTTDELCADSDLAGVPEEEVVESLVMLERAELVIVDWTGPGANARLTPTGFRRYAEAFVDDYAETLKAVGGYLLNQDVRENEQIATRTGKPINLINYLLDVLAADGHIQVAKYGGGRWEVAGISPSLKRSLA